MKKLHRIQPCVPMTTVYTPKRKCGKMCWKFWKMPRKYKFTKWRMSQSSGRVRDLDRFFFFFFQVSFSLFRFFFFHVGVLYLYKFIYIPPTFLELTSSSSLPPFALKIVNTKKSKFFCWLDLCFWLSVVGCFFFIKKLIEHIAECKHMKCTRPQCDIDFCFVCLEVNKKTFTFFFWQL